MRFFFTPVTVTHYPERFISSPYPNLQFLNTTTCSNARTYTHPMPRPPAPPSMLPRPSLASISPSPASNTFSLFFPRPYPPFLGTTTLISIAVDISIVPPPGPSSPQVHIPKLQPPIQALSSVPSFHFQKRECGIDYRALWRVKDSSLSCSPRLQHIDTPDRGRHVTGLRCAVCLVNKIEVPCILSCSDP